MSGFNNYSPDGKRLATAISDGTVKLHVKAILRKLGVHSRVEAAVIAVEQGMRSGRDGAA